MVADRPPLKRRIADGVLFVGFLALSALAIAAVAIATPLILAASSLIGLFQKDTAASNWRPAGA